MTAGEGAAWRRVVCLFPYDAAGRVLLQHRDADAPHYPGYWGFFGGGIEPGETVLEAARREALEELELPLTAPQFILSQRIEGIEKHILAQRCADPDALMLHEGQGWGWYGIDEAVRLRVPWHDVDVLRAFGDWYGNTCNAQGMMAE